MTSAEYRFYTDIKERARKIYYDFKSDKALLRQLLTQLKREVYLSDLPSAEKSELIKAIEYWE